MSCPECEHCQRRAFELSASAVARRISTAAGTAYAALIIAEVSSRSGLTVERLLGRSKAKPVADRRLVAYWLTRQLTELSLAEIGKCFGRDHSSVVSGINRVSRWLKEKPMFAAEVDEMKRALKLRSRTMVPEVRAA